MARPIRATPTTTPPSAQKFTSFFYATTTQHADNNWPTINDQHRRPERASTLTATRRGPNLGCGTPITPLTASKATIKAAINAMGPWSSAAAPPATSG